MNYFDISKNYLEKIFDKPTFDKWILPLVFIGHINDTIFVGVEDKSKFDWVYKNLLPNINSNLKKEFNFVFKIVPLFEESSLDSSQSFNQNHDKNIEENFMFQSNIIKKYSFESFVQLESNKMAYSFAHSVSEFPGKSYNPLYIYSDVGLGKTHLMYAIGNRLLQQNSSTKVLYLTTRDFMNDYVEYTRLNKRSEFLKKYTSIDVLLIDDIQYITQWGGTKEQFYYIFNKLIELEKQIVIAADKHPENIPDLEHRIKSRFEWGGLVDILHYDLEGRIAILKKKIQERKHLIKNQFIIPDDVIYFLASSVKENIRKLEGALNRLIGYANLKYCDSLGNIITMPFAKEALQPFISIGKSSITILSIQEFIAKKFDISISDLKSKNNSRKIAWPRQISMYLCKKLTKHPLDEIGHNFGDKHHTTVLHSIKKVESEIENNIEFSKKISDILSFFS